MYVQVSSNVCMCVRSVCMHFYRPREKLMLCEVIRDAIARKDLRTGPSYESTFNIRIYNVIRHHNAAHHGVQIIELLAYRCDEDHGVADVNQHSIQKVQPPVINNLFHCQCTDGQQK
jgi:hypothetical protein